MPSEVDLTGVRVLLVDDEPNLLRVMRRILTRRGAEVESAGNGFAALEVLEHYRPDVLLTDLKMPQLDGIGLLRAVRERGLEAIILVLTGHGTMDTAIEAMRSGARDYLLKPIDPDELLRVIGRELEAGRLRRENTRLRGEVRQLSRRLEHFEGFGDMIGDSAPMREVYRQIERLCQFHDVNVLVVGETGTGKELVARALHTRSPRAGRAFVAINCAAIPADLQESQLFGHAKGSFTGALDDHTGAFVAADGGTLLLDEVGEMRLEMQVKLLRALEERAVTPLGHNQPTAVDVRVVAATNRDLARAVDEGLFRADLYNRLEGAVIVCPPLRDRRDDIPALADHILRRTAENYGVRPKRLSGEAMRRLVQHQWPGNVRELQNVLRRAVVFAAGDTIAADELDIAPVALDPPAAPAADSGDLGTLESQERRAIVDALDRTRGNKSAAAELLGIDRKKLYRRLRRYGLD